jgi:hypothetical protein
MKLSHFILIFFIAVNAFSQTDLEQLDIINNKFIELISNYNENKILIKYDQFEDIINVFDYVFIKNNDSVNFIIENNQNKIIFSENSLMLEIIPIFGPMHLTASFTYCTGKISINNLVYEFYLYENNEYSWDINEIENDDNLSFCYFDVNNENYAYFNIYNTNEHELFIINKYENIEYFLEILSSKISTIVIFNKNNL